MLKQSPSRIPRSKGFKVMQALQICVLLVICIWFLYQVKQWYGKNAALEESSKKISEEACIGDKVMKLGRKGLNPQLEETAAVFEKRWEEELDEEEDENKLRDNYEYKAGAGDDDIDGSDQEKREEEEPEELEDLIDEDLTDERSKGREVIESDNYFEDITEKSENGVLKVVKEEEQVKDTAKSELVVEN